MLASSLALETFKTVNMGLHAEEAAKPICIRRRHGYRQRDSRLGATRHKPTMRVFATHLACVQRTRRLSLADKGSRGFWLRGHD